MAAPGEYNMAARGNSGSSSGGGSLGFAGGMNDWPPSSTSAWNTSFPPNEYLHPPPQQQQLSGGGGGGLATPFPHPHPNYRPHILTTNSTPQFGAATPHYADAQPASYPPPPVHHPPPQHLPSLPLTGGGAAPSPASYGGSGVIAGHPADPNPNLYIHNVPKDADENEIAEIFGRYGPVERVRLKVNQKVGPFAVYAFVTFSNTRDAAHALEALQGFDIRGRKLRVEYQRTSSPPRSCPQEGEGGGGHRHRQRGNSDLSGGGGGHLRSKPSDRSPAPSHPSSGRGPSGRGVGGAWAPNTGAATSVNTSSFGFPTSFGRGAAVVDPPSNPSSNRSNFRRDTSTRRASSRLRDDHSRGRTRREFHDNSREVGGNGPVKRLRRDDTNRSTTAEMLAPPTPKRTKIFLCHLLPHILPHLFPATPAQYPQQQQQQRPTFTESSGVEEAVPPVVRPAPEASQPSGPPRDPPSASVSKPIAGEGKNSPESPPSSASHFVSWRGPLVRNNKRKVMIEIVELEGNVAQFLPPMGDSTSLLNISHRSTYSELLKKDLRAVCCFRASDDNNTKAFEDYIHYFVTKDRAGVISLIDSSNVLLYIIPPRTAIFQKCQQHQKFQSDKMLLGLIAAQSPTPRPPPPSDSLRAAILSLRVGANPSAPAAPMSTPLDSTSSTLMEIDEGG